MQVTEQLFAFRKSIDKAGKTHVVRDVFDLFYNDKLCLFKSLMASKEKEIHIALSNFLWYAFKRREQLLTRP